VGDQGRQAWMTEETLNKPKELGIEDRVIFTGFVESGEVPYLFAGSIAYVLPSLYEGFGIPLLDAMATGTPIIAANNSSIPEVVGDAGLLVETKSVDQYEHAIRLFMTDSRIRNSYIKKGLNQTKKFSWKKMAREVLKILETV
jgi:glycosyltransferase involved in cell wall biosynthesis